MSAELQSRPAASRGGRGATRGGRGGFAGRNSTRRANGEAKHEDSLDAAVEDEGEIGQLKKLYGDKTPIVKEMFPDWSEVDILFALRETDGDVEHAVTSIAEGHISQWDEVSKPKKTKANKEPAAAVDSAMTRAIRNAGAGPDKTRGRSNARAAERGGRSARGRSAQPPHTTAARADKSAALSIPTEESHAYEAAAKLAVEDAPTTEQPSETQTPTPAASSAAPAAKTWASMLRQSTAPPKPAPKPKEPAAPKPAPESTDPLPPPPTSTSASAPEAAAAAPPTPADAAPADTPSDVPPPIESADPAPAAVAQDAAAATPAEKPSAPETVVPAIPAVAVPGINLPPPKDELTKHNLEQVADDTKPPQTDTNYSEANDSWDPQAGALSGVGTPISASQQQHQNAAKTLGSGYAATAIKATDRAAVRTPSYSRRILDQEEAVRMPVNRDVDIATMKFGALNFTGAADEDIDGEREEPETRTQPPDESPVAHPRASLPPAGLHNDAFAAAPKQPAAANTALPPHAATASAAATPVAAAAAVPPTAPAAQQYGRFGQTGGAQEAAAGFGQKPFDAYAPPSQPQAAVAPHYDAGYQGLPGATQGAAQQVPPAAFSTAPSEYAQYFTSDHSRAPYNNYYGAYGQQAAQGHQDAVQSQRSYSGYPSNDTLSQYPQSNNARFGGAAAAGVATTAAADAQNSGTTTPNPPAAGPPQTQAQTAGAQTQHSLQQQAANQYQYGGHPYYTSPYYAQYVSQQYGAFGQGNFGGPYGGKGGYGGSHLPYGMNPQQNPYEQHSAASPGSGFGASASLRHGGGGADSSVLGAAGLGDYNRVGGQSVGQQSSFGGSHDGSSFGRGGAASYQTQASQYGTQPSQVGGGGSQAGGGGGGGGGADELKAYGDASKGAGGATPSSLARPGSATNPQAAQAGLPPAQTAAQQAAAGYGGYPSHLQQTGLHGSQNVGGNYGGNQYGSYGGHNAHAHGQGFGGNSYYSQQQPRGWGGNYH